MLKFFYKHDLTVLLTLYIFMLPLGKTLWYPLFVMACIGVVLFYREARLNMRLETGTRWLIFCGMCVWIPAIISLVGTIDSERTLVFVLTYPLFFLAGYFIYKRVSGGYSLYPSIYLTTTIVTLWGFLAIWQYLDPNNPFGAGGSHNQGIHTRDNQFVDGGLMMGVILGSLFGFLTLSFWNKGHRVAAVLLGFFIIFLCFISGTRSSWLSVLATIGFFSIIPFLRGHRLDKKVWIGVGLSTALIFGSFSTLISMPGLNQKLDQTLVFFQNPSLGTLDKTLSGRIGIWRDAIKLGAEFPLTGTGVNNFRFAHPLVAEGGNPWIHDFSEESDGKHPLKGATHAHQIFLEAWAGAGLLGVLGLVVLFVHVARTTHSVMKTGSFIAIGALVAFWAGFFPLNTHNNFYGGWLNAWFWIWLGIAAGLIFKQLKAEGVK